MSLCGLWRSSSLSSETLKTDYKLLACKITAPLFTLKHSEYIFISLNHSPCHLIILKSLRLNLNHDFSFILINHATLKYLVIDIHSYDLIGESWNERRSQVLPSPLVLVKQENYKTLKCRKTDTQWRKDRYIQWKRSSSKQNYWRHQTAEKTAVNTISIYAGYTYNMN